MLKLSPPQPILACIRTLNTHGYPAYFVGGCVRDALMGRTPHDWDICTGALPEQISQCFEGYKTILVGIRHGTVAVVTDSGTVEITTFRQDGGYDDHRKPRQVTFSRSLPEDLARRDLTVNAMAWHPDEGLIDCYHGAEDLARRIIRCVGDPLVRFDEDALRILRMFRFSSQLGFSIDPQTLEGARERCGLLVHLSGERVQAELGKILLSESVCQTLELMAATGALAQIIPEFKACYGFDQHTPYHNRTVDKHIFQSVENAPPLLPVRLALLFHDIAKPACYWQDTEGVGHFTGHQKASAEAAEQILGRLRYDTYTLRWVVKLIELHDQGIDPDVLSIKRLLSQHGAEFLQQLVEVRLADTGAKNSGMVEKRTERLLRAKALIPQVLDSGEPYRAEDLAVSGNDLLDLGFVPSRALGDTLSYLLELVQSDPACNSRDYLLSQAVHLLEQSRPADLSSFPQAHNP